jgi:hypothetical protein
MFARKCDRCGEFYMPYGGVPGLDGSRTSGFEFIGTDKMARYRGVEVDLCPACAEELVKWYNAKMPHENNYKIEET